MKRIEKTGDCYSFVSSVTSQDMNFSFENLVESLELVACREYPHPRHLCLNSPFRSIPNATHCHLCCCCVGDKPAPCAQWISSHCKASSVDSMEPKSPTLENESFFCSDYDHLFVDSSPLPHIFE
ncbi:hypothetical protein BRARA_C01373 [Brassica rapa]|uniref:Uncharacterized protein n=1 Tax=Brassica campestris TaxID=3711 RepID=A0A397ZUR7_BRACM|nr:hypothetical protein BRARA_C01373 [Brassica rapa]